MARWGDERTIQFIHLYREYECLWKPTSSFYKNKIARANAYSKIQEELNLTEKEIKNKIKSLRSTYHQERNKVENSKRSGAGSSVIYKPSLIWFKEMDFINESFEYRNSIQTAVVSTYSFFLTCMLTLDNRWRCSVLIALSVILVILILAFDEMLIIKSFHFVTTDGAVLF